MNAPVFTQDNLLFTVTTPLGDNKLLFKSLQGEEYLSNLFHFQLEMLSESKQLNFDDIIGQALTVEVQFAPEHHRYFHGIVTRFVQAGTDARFTIYHAEVRPWLWLLTLTKNCRIFQKLAVPDIIRKVFSDLGFSDYRFALIKPGGYEKRDYCVQYEETAFNFVSRLMEDEGLFYFFEHQADRHILVIADDLGAHKPCPGIPKARYLQVTNETQPENAITNCYFTQQLTTGQYAIDDFNFETPALDLKTSVDSETYPMRIYEYSAGFLNRGQGEQKVKCRLEGCTAEQQLLEGQGHCFSFISGYKFTLVNHPRQDFNKDYVLQWLSHSLSLTHYSNAFRAFPATVAFRPPVTTPKPRIVSTQTAIVTGPGGEEIWTDKYGRIKVQFHWDQEGQVDENSSCWIRVNQSWAGKGYGNLCIPRIGQEVIVSFVNGNPDEPLVTGAVYNAQQTVPNSLPSGQNKSTMKSNTTPGGGGSNEMSMDDTKGKEKVYIHAQKDLEQVVENNMSTTVKVDQTLTVNSNRTKEVKADQKETVGANKTISVGADHKESISANKTLSVGANHKETIGANMELTVGGTKTETITGATTITINGAYGFTANSAVNETINGAKTETVSSNKTETVGGNKTEDVTGTCKTIAPTVIIDAGQEITLKVGGNSIKIDSSGISINGVKITSAASGVNEITGSTVKLN
jgi:type VI secretion system secreted protein VgrG